MREAAAVQRVNKLFFTCRSIMYNNNNILLSKYGFGVKPLKNNRTLQTLNNIL